MFRSGVFWDRVEYGGTVATVLLGGAAAFGLRPGWLVAVLVVASGVVTATAKYRGKRLAEDQKRTQAAEAAALREKYEAQARQMVSGLLDLLRADYFDGEDPLEKHKHRATLFVCEPTADGTGKQLTTYARSGLFNDTRRTWPVDENRLGNCRSVASQVWFHGAPVVAVAGRDWPGE